MKRTMLALLAAWLLGIATALGGVAVTGGWYEYRYINGNSSEPSDLQVAKTWLEGRMPIVEAQYGRGGWQPVANVTAPANWHWLQRPRIRLGW